MRKISRLGLPGLLVVLALVANSVLGPWRSGSANAAVVPSGLPSHFGFGLSASPDNSGIYGWMPSSGIPWDYAYQYLSGGVNSGAGWETWNAQGQFALWYAQGADSHHYIPVFPYYELLQSNGSCGSCGEAQRDLSNLNNAGTMQSYFANFRLLMQRLGTGTYNGIAGFGKTAIVQVEPDLSGYAEQAALNSGACYGYCSGSGNNPALLRAAVATSGDPDVAAFPNTYQGFNWALLHLRDLYAPNVLLAFHVSNWATGTDIGGNSSPTLDPTALGQEAGSFAAQSGTTGLPAGVKGYDLIFNDVLDRDAAYYKYVYGDSSRWWDRLNVTFPNFHRWEAYVGAVSSATGRSLIIWQVPEGNQYFATENNTNGHYQDNRAEYFFAHVGELAGVGVIGVLFGAGNGGSTVHTDGMNDGITNPASFCTSDGLSSGQICNNHTSSSSDDDGGYIRMQGQQYYAGGGYSLGGGVPPTATPSATATQTPRPATSTATSTATATQTPKPATSTATATATATQTPRAATSTATATQTPKAPTATATLTPRVPTATVTRTPLATSTPNANLTIKDTTTAQPANPARSTTTTINTTITATSGSLSNGIVDLEVYNNANWTKVGQQVFSGQNLSSGHSLSYQYRWPVPNAAGQYTVMVGVFGPNWSKDYYWDSSAAHLSVQ